MKASGDVVLLRFPFSDQAQGKLRPAMLLAKVPGPHDDWLICMITSQIRHAIPQFDEWIEPEDADFLESGLKVPSTIRIARLAVAQKDVAVGRLGRVSQARLQSMRGHLSEWLGGLLPSS